MGGRGGSSNSDFGSAQNWIIGTVTLVSCILFNIFAKSIWKQLSVLFGLVVGYILSCFMGVVDFSTITGTKVVALPELMPFKLEFVPGAIIAMVMIFLVSATETIGTVSFENVTFFGTPVKDSEALTLYVGEFATQPEFVENN